MKKDDFIVSTFTVSMDEFEQIFPWFENLTDGMPVEKPKSKQMTDMAVEMKSSK